jgi:hypothetical protein
MSYTLGNAYLIVFQEENPPMPPICYMHKKGCWTIRIQSKEGEVLLPLTDGLRSRIMSLCTVIEELQQECSLALSKVPDSTSLFASVGSSLSGRS